MGVTCNYLFFREICAYHCYRNQKAMPKQICVHTEDVNTHGYWIRTAGIDMAPFKKNPVMLWNHSEPWRGTEEEHLPIGVWKDIQVLDDGRVVMTPEFDLDDEFAAKIAKKYDKGHIRASSISVRITKWSDDPSDLKPGQKRPTVTGCELREVSLVIIPGNRNAVTQVGADLASILLCDESGAVLNLSEGSDSPMPLLEPKKDNGNKNTVTMNELQILAVQLGLKENASLADIRKTVVQLQKAEAENDQLKAKLADFETAQKAAQKARAKELLDAALADNRIAEAERPEMEELFDANFEAADRLLAKRQAAPAGKLADFVEPAKDGEGGPVKHNGKTFSELSKENPQALAKLRDANFQLFSRMYESEYGKPYRK